MTDPRTFPHSNDRAFASAQATDERLGLSRVDPQLRAIWRQAQLPSNMGLRARTLYLQRVQSYDVALREMPFFPAAESSGDVALVRDQVSGETLHAPAVALTGHGLVVGSTSFGKTSVAACITESVQRAHPTTLVSYFDPKNDWRARTYADPRCIAITPDIPLNIFRPPSFLAPEHYDALLLDAFARSHWAGYHQSRSFTMAKDRARTMTEDPSMHDVVTQLDRLLGKEFTYGERDAAGNMQYKLGQFARIARGIYYAKGRCLTMESLANVPVWWPMVPGDSYEFLFTLWLQVKFHYNQAHHIHDTLHSLVVIDESLQIFSEHTSHMDGSALMDRAISTMREPGIGLLFTASSRKNLSQLVKSNATCQIAMGMTDGAEAEDIKRTFQLTPDEFAYYQRLKPLECIVHCPSRWPNNVLGIVPPFTDKFVTDADFHRAATERQRALLPPTPMPITITTNAPNSADAEGQRLRLTRTDVEHSTIAHNTDVPDAEALRTIPHNSIDDSTRLTAAPQSPTENATATPPPVTITPALEALLSVIGRETIITSTPAYKKANLGLSAGDGAAKQGETLGLLTRSPILALSRKNAVALELTDEGYQRMQLKRPHGTRGGDSAQHRYIVHSIMRVTTGARIETQIGTTTCDITVRLTDQHAVFIEAIAHNAQYLTMNHHALRPGDLIAIEVEVSNPRKTASKNVIANHEHGITCTIIATMPKKMEATIRALAKGVPPQLHARVVIIDAFDLLNALRDPPVHDVTRQVPDATNNSTTD